jgi:regulator of protease activity HflC (stomatin/prohibitin superfamily)
MTEHTPGRPAADDHDGDDGDATPNQEHPYELVREMPVARLVQALRRALRPAAACVVAGAAGWLLWKHPPVRTVAPGELGVRVNRLTGGASELRPGSVLVVPGLQTLRTYALRDRVFRPAQGASADGAGAFQSAEGLSIGVDLAVRYALDPARVAAAARTLPDDIDGQVVAPEVQGIAYRTLTRYSVREIFSTRRAEIQQAIESELRTRLAADGLVLRSVQMGRIDLPADYRRGMEALLAQELESEKMRYTLELKDKQVKESELEAEAEKVKREKAAEAAGDEQVIAARAQEEAMKHVLPFKEKQIQQRQLEAEADKLSRIKAAEGSAEARRIEAAGEADSRTKLADAEVYRLEKVGRTTSEQMARDGALLSRHPLLIQKTMADKLSDKIQVIIAPTPADGGFIGAALLGGGRHAGAGAADAVKTAAAQDAAPVDADADGAAGGDADAAPQGGRP